MKKFWFLLLIISIVVTGLTIIPYWTGVEAERQFAGFDKSFYAKMNLKPIDTTYERGWFHSYAQTTVETLTPSYSNSEKQRFILAHDIDHGFMPVQSSLIRTTLHTVNEDENVTVDLLGTELLEARTVVQPNGDSVSTFTIPALPFKDDNANLQWQGLQGTVYAKQNFASVQTEMHSPQVQLQTEQGKIVMQGITFNAALQPNEVHFLQGKGSLTIANLLLFGKQTTPVKLAGITLEGNNHIVDDNLMISVKTGLQQIEVGTEHYGPGYGDFELHRWHVPTLHRIKNTLTEMQGQAVVPTKLMPYGLALLKNAPEFAITRLSFKMPEGELRGKLQVKFVAFNPLLLLNLFNAQLDLLLNLFNAQLEMHIPQVLLDNLTQDTLSTTSSKTPQTLGQHLKAWLAQGILVPASEQPDYYYSQMQLKEGVLQVNGQQLPLANFWSQK